ncbi:hypothetical protein [Comamonas testosteroni]|uniref:hypothetical protein n=1 Tax=Comamonas testosteroni TaxID=285 RepID=UPI000B0F2BA7|nr:hypothetical protein [Comamonas testosteroni]
MQIVIDEFQNTLKNCFRELVLATAYLQIGQQALFRSPRDASVSLVLAEGLETEPMFLRELQPHSAAVVFGVAELFQTKVVAAWADLLSGLFEQFVNQHIGGHRQFPAFRKRTTKLDFGSSEDVLTQVRAGLVADFAFSKYSERIQTIDRALAPNETRNRHLQFIRKHVLIRNATQHHGGRIYEDMLRDLAAGSVQVQDSNGRAKSLSLGDSIELHVPELDLLKSSFFIVTNDWRHQLV